VRKKYQKGKRRWKKKASVVFKEGEKNLKRNWGVGKGSAEKKGREFF